MRPINRFVIAPLMAVYFWVIFFPISFLIRITQIPRIIGLLQRLIFGNVVGRTLWRIITFPFLYPPINWTIDLLRLLNPMRYLPVPPPGYFNRGTTSGKKVKKTPSKKR